MKELDKMELDKIVLKTAPPVLYLQNPVFGIKVITNNNKLCVKTNVKTNLNKNLTDKNKAYRKNTQQLRIMKERLLTYIPL